MYCVKRKKIRQDDKSKKKKKIEKLQQKKKDVSMTILETFT